MRTPWCISNAMVAFPRDLRGRTDQLTRFSDETSVDSRTTGDQKVPVYATIPRDSEMGWYHDLVAHLPDVAGEVKSRHVLAQFELLPTALQERVWRGLRRASVHIADPRPYLGLVDDAYHEATGQSFSEREFRERRRKGEEIATFHWSSLER